MMRQYDSGNLVVRAGNASERDVLAGSAQSLACTDDPQHAWVKETYRKKDPRVPLYDVTEGRRP